MTTPPMTCDRLDELLPDFLESALGAGDLVAVREHAVACERCAALIEDMTALRDEAAALPQLQPSRDLWPSIAERIAAPVVSLTPQPSLVSHRRWSATRLASAAAALIVLTAGVTYQLTRRLTRARTDVVAVAPAAAVTAETGSTVPRPALPAPGAQSSPVPALPSPLRTLARPVARVASRQPAEATFEREVVALRRILDQRRASLDPATLEILERNMHVIDAAIAESRAALARDPASHFLNQQLNSALDKKLELMRTTAMLPSRT